MRLQKYLAMGGVASRRACEKLIENGEVTINGIVAHIGDCVQEGDVVEFDGKIIKPEEELVYYLLFKPVGVITTAKDERGRRTVLDIVKVPQRIYPVGRLDVNTSGLLLLTNDGELANRITHPSFEVEKTYKAIVKGRVLDREIEMLREGVMLEDGITAPAKVRMINFDGDKSMVEISIVEGRNRQVRRMFEAIGHEVRGLRRVRVGKLGLGKLQKGEYRSLTEAEIKYLKDLVMDKQ